MVERLAGHRGIFWQKRIPSRKERKDFWKKQIAAEGKGRIFVTILHNQADISYNRKLNLGKAIDERPKGL